MVKAQQLEHKPQKSIQKLNKSKYNTFDNLGQVDTKNRATWFTDAVVYIGHIPHAFYEEQLKTYFTQYG